MFHIVKGSFHPVLESSLAEEIQRVKAHDRLAPLAIVVPSAMLRRRVQQFLCVEYGLGLYDVHVLTFHQLALRLRDEQLMDASDMGDIPASRQVSDPVFRFLLQSILGLSEDSEGAWKGKPYSPGVCEALWATIRDLKEAMVPPSVIRQGLDEGVFDPDSVETLHAVCEAYEALLAKTDSLQICGPDDLASRVISYVPHSPFLSRLSRAYYYGFYDLTQIQLSLFEAVTRRVTVTLFLPLENESTYAFARRFYDRHLATGAFQRTQSDVTLPATDSSPSASPARIMNVLNCVGPEDELRLVCKEILNLIDAHGYQFDEIGVIARSLEPYHAFMGSIFTEHRIPYTSSASISIVDQPIVKFLLHLTSLPVNQYEANTMIDVLRSPFYRGGFDADRPGTVQPERWPELLQAYGIVRGKDDWSKLSRAQKSPQTTASNKTAEMSEYVATGARSHGCESVEAYHALAQELLQRCEAFPAEGSIEELTESVRRFVAEHVNLEPFDKDHLATREVAPAELVRHIFDCLDQMEGFWEKMTWEDWSNLLVQVVQSWPLAPKAAPHRGLRVLDAMSARGLPFRAVFLVGLNEHAFPRAIREDALLRDSQRRVLAETLGYKIDEKLSGYEEERLLFALARQSARERLFFSYQRASDDGRLLAPSSFLHESVYPEAEASTVGETVLARRFSDQLKEPQFRDRLLTREEMGFKLIQQAQDPSVLLDLGHHEALIFQQGRQALAMLDNSSSRLGLYDGMLTEVKGHRPELLEPGLSPTAIERYASCPFQYMALDLLDLETPRTLPSEELPASMIGSLYHAVLQKVYASLIQEGWPNEQASPEFHRGRVDVLVEDVFADHARTQPTGHWLMWHWLKEVVTSVVKAEVDASYHDCLDSGFRPIAVEVKAHGQVAWPDESAVTQRLHGRFDRVDYRDQTGDIRIVDYKVKLSVRKQTHEEDLLASGIRGRRLQAPLYSLMAPEWDSHGMIEVSADADPESVAFIYLSPNRESLITRSKFERNVWKSDDGQLLKSTISRLVRGIQEWEFFILPEEYCQYCPVSVACRRVHEATRNRWYRSNRVKEFRAIRKQDIPSSQGRQGKTKR